MSLTQMFKIMTARAKREHIVERSWDLISRYLHLNTVSPFITVPLWGNHYSFCKMRLILNTKLLAVFRGLNEYMCVGKKQLCEWQSVLNIYTCSWERLPFLNWQYQHNHTCFLWPNCLGNVLLTPIITSIATRAECGHRTLIWLATSRCVCPWNDVQNKIPIFNCYS